MNMLLKRKIQKVWDDNLARKSDSVQAAALNSI